MYSWECLIHTYLTIEKWISLKIGNIFCIWLIRSLRDKQHFHIYVVSRPPCLALFNQGNTCIWDNDNHVMKVYSNNPHLCLSDGDISGDYHKNNCLFKIYAFWKHVHGTCSHRFLPWYIRNGSENYSVPNGQQAIIETRDDSVWWGIGFTGLRWVCIKYCEMFCRPLHNILTSAVTNRFCHPLLYWMRNILQSLGECYGFDSLGACVSRWYDIYFVNSV